MRSVSAATGVCPLVIFSYGGLGIKSSNVSLYNELASHGSVVGHLLLTGLVLSSPFLPSNAKTQ